MKTQALVVAASVLGFAIGCGGSSNSSVGDQTPPAATDTPPAATDMPATPPPPKDHGAVSTTYPAFTPEVGQLVDNGGQVLTNPVIVTVTWANEPNVDTFEQFADALGPSAYWKQVTSEYGVGPATSGATQHIRLADPPPATINDSDIPALLAQHLQANDGVLPAATGNEIYIFYIPEKSTFNLQGQEVCSTGVGGYHENTAVGGKQVAFAVVPQCGGLDETTLSASHELAEAATDPFPMALPAYSGFDDNHLAWEFFQQFQSENGDACEFYREAPMDATSFGVPFTTQRQWSNKSGAGGHNPCVPAPQGPYFNVTPLDLESIDLDLSALGGDTATTKGYKVKVGETKTVPFGFYSDAATTGPWTITAQLGGIMGRTSGSVDLSFDVTSGQNGQKAYLTITANTAGKTGGELVTIVSNLNGTKHYMPIMIGSPAK
ncbi:MAG TPA: hypothetical protein VIF62_08135 [Labilithrix sp.]|jgi:hypothetical protein